MDGAPLCPFVREWIVRDRRRSPDWSTTITPQSLSPFASSEGDYSPIRLSSPEPTTRRSPSPPFRFRCGPAQPNQTPVVPQRSPKCRRLSAWDPDRPSHASISDHTCASPRLHTSFSLFKLVPWSFLAHHHQLRNCNHMLYGRPLSVGQKRPEGFWAPRCRSHLRTSLVRANRI
jgi:hypothetical protein